jgi:hypothetical protein
MNKIVKNINNFYKYLYSFTPKAKAEDGERKRLALKRRICSFA